MRFRLTHILLFLNLLMLQACSMQQMTFNQLATELDNGNAKAILTEVQSRDFPDRDLVQYKLTLGLLLAVEGRFTEAISELQIAKQAIERLQASSVSENLGAVTVNETLRSYASSPSERMLLQQLLVLSYLLQQDLDGARVEVLQMQEIAKQLPEEGLSGFVSSSYYLAGLIYEMNDETDNALISYRQAYQSILKSKLPVPKALQESLLWGTHSLGLYDELRRYEARFGLSFKPRDKNTADLVLLYWGETVASKQQRFLSVYVPNLGYNVSLALPYYLEQYRRSSAMHFNLQGRSISLEKMDDVNKLAEADLDAQSTDIYAATLARVVVKQTALHEVKERDSNGIATLLLNITSMITESADLRSWNMLPASIQIQRISVPANLYAIEQPTEHRGLRFISQSNNAPASINNISLEAGDIGFVFISSASNKAFHYVAPQ